MIGERLRVLMVEDDADFAKLTQRTLNEAEQGQVDLTLVPTLTEAMRIIRRESFDAILLDLSLPDSQGLDTFTQMRISAPDTAIVVLSVNDDFRMAIQSVREGAQDYLVKGEVGGALISRSLRYAVERQNTIDTLRRLSMLDELTQLYNRRGFFTLAEQHLKLAERSGRDLVLAFGDVDGLKQINDSHGHTAGDQALRRVADVLRNSFRRSDILARIGGDEFTILAIDVTREKTDGLFKRFEKALADENGRCSSGFSVTLSLGIVQIDHIQRLSIQEWLTKADQALYASRQSRY